MEDKIFLCKEVAKDSLRQAFNHFGIEGTEDKIKELYGNNVEALDFLLEVYNEMLKGGGK